jgi:hypothetical protein
VERVEQQGISPVQHWLYGVFHPLLPWVERVEQQQHQTATKPVLDWLYGVFHPVPPTFALGGTARAKEKPRRTGASDSERHVV